ncbi:MAG: response regulator [Desulfatibacillum sp.]|nr:response regulator [Desulfatibacillum sp.]
MRNLLAIPFLRNILIASLVTAVLVPSVVINLVYPKYSRMHIQTTEDDAVRFARHWASGFDWAGDDQVSGLHSKDVLGEIRKMEKDLGASKVRVFSKWGDIIYSSDSDEIGTRNAKDYFHEIVARGNVFSKVVNKNTRSAEGQIIPTDVVEVYVPLMQEGVFMGALEIYYDITGSKQKLDALTTASTWLVIVLVAALEGVIIFLLHRAGYMFARRKEIENQLRYEKEFGDAVFNSIADPIAVIDPRTFEVIKANRTLLKETNMAPEQFSPMPCHVLTHQENTPCFGADHACPLLRTYSTGQPAQEEHVHHRPDGEMVYVDVITYPIKNEIGEVQHVVHITRENTERKTAQEEKQLLEKKLDRSKKMEAIGLLAGGVAHDLNNVLSGIVSYPDLMLMDCPPEDKAMRESLEIIRDSGLKASNIVMDLLTMARRGVMEMEVLNLNEIVRDYLTSPEYSKLRAYHPNVKVRFSASDDLFNIKGSEVHLRKSIMNLVSNAAEAMPQGGDIHISTTNSHVNQLQTDNKAMAPGDYAMLMITDTGIGIDEADLTRIFEPFYTKKKMGRSGTGLGMAVVWGTVQDHEGYIDVSSTPGKGATFVLRFPVTLEPLLDSQDDTSPADYQGSHESILVVDDMPQQLELASGILTRLGYRVRVAESGEKALQMLRESPADLVVLDTVMNSEMDGLEIHEKIRSLYPEQKAFITSGYFEPELVEKAKKAGIHQYLKKPFTIKSLGLAVKRELER